MENSKGKSEKYFNKEILYNRIDGIPYSYDFCVIKFLYGLFFLVWSSIARTENDYAAYHLATTLKYLINFYLHQRLSILSTMNSVTILKKNKLLIIGWNSSEKLFYWIISTKLHFHSCSYNLSICSKIKLDIKKKTKTINSKKTVGVNQVSCVYHFLYIVKQFSVEEYNFLKPSMFHFIATPK